MWWIASIVIRCPPISIRLTKCPLTQEYRPEVAEHFERLGEGVEVRGWGFTEQKAKHMYAFYFTKMGFALLIIEALLGVNFDK